MSEDPIIQRSYDGTVQRILKEYSDEQTAALRLLCVIRPLHKDIIFDEVLRRSVFYRTFYKETSVGASKNVMLLAFESVYEDAIRGFFG